ncbi:unnamed protein product [Cylicocyclus nassatus]|uniref:Endonuclease-reverse transcriptase n=1 Tax=Cylicocyclus nassatus TaxID=53992 RepID=A0AA36M3E8_CYLNA|nr:unnamed protein product [Cylicocyclus nassatus]
MGKITIRFFSTYVPPKADDDYEDEQWNQAEAILQKSMAHSKRVCCMKSMNYYGKAFDTVEVNGLWTALEEQGVHWQLVTLLRQVYTSSNSIVKVGEASVPINVERGVRQGETWTVTKKMEKQLSAAGRRIERRMVGSRLLDKKTNSWLRGVTKVKDLVTCAKKRKWNYAWKLANRNEIKWSRELMEWRPPKASTTADEMEHEFQKKLGTTGAIR